MTRDESLVVIEGFHAVKHAVRFGAELVEVRVVDPGEVEALAAELAADVAPALRAAMTVVGPGELDGPTGQRVPGRIVAVARRPPDRVGEVLGRPAGDAPAVLLDEPRHLGNVGAAIRVAAAAGAEALATTGAADPWHPAAVRGAAGLQFALPVGRVDVASVRRPIVGLDPEGAPLAETPLPPGAVLAFGSERRGLGDEVRAAAQATVSLPMRPGVSSLNLATAVAAVLYTLRQ